MRFLINEIMRRRNSDLGRRLPVEVLFYGTKEGSQYNYTLGNPVNLIDPDGTEVKNPYKKGTREYIQVQSAINNFKATPSGLKLYNKLNNIDQLIDIRIGDVLDRSGKNNPSLGITYAEGDERNNKFLGATIILDFKDIEENRNFGKGQAPEFTLAHEFKHVDQFLENYNYWTNPNNKQGEKSPLEFEDIIRKEMSDFLKHLGNKIPFKLEDVEAEWTR